jgi:uncharacterized protein YjcR
MKSLTDKITPYRSLWESDPAVTFTTIANEVGCSSATVGSVAKRQSWEAKEGVEKKRRQLYFVARAGQVPPKDMAAMAPAVGNAWPSIWAAASGSTVSTSRKEVGSDAC